MVYQQNRYRDVLKHQSKIYRFRKNILHDRHVQSECPSCFKKGIFNSISCGHIICPVCFKNHNKCPICIVSNKLIDTTVPLEKKQNWGYLIYKLIYITKLYPEYNWDQQNFINYNYRYPFDTVKYDNVAGIKDNMSVDIGELFS